ncbi:hypothetical protein ABZ488_07680 [Streptomyces griseus]|uniref:hypothetical protein n=1 Tax=Streptomyces griseus TaxID=1911 RepID=UPI0033E955EA
MTDASPTPADQLRAAAGHAPSPELGRLLATLADASDHHPTGEGGVVATVVHPALAMARQLLDGAPAPAVWAGGDPLMEAIAAGVYEQCGTDPVSSVVVDDPRTIAAVAVTVARRILGTSTAAECGCDPAPHRKDDGTYSHWAGCPVADVQQAAAPPAPADRAATRDRIRRAICEASGFDWDPDTLEPDEYGEHADAVLAVLAADAAAGVQPPTTTEAGLSYRLEHRHREERTWRPNTPGIGANWSWQSREKAAQRLAEARDRWPAFEHRLIETTTKVASHVLPNCLACGHHRCDGDGPCGALLDAWQRCTCTATPPAAPAAPEEPAPAPQCSAGLLPATDEAVDRCVRHGVHDTHATAAGVRWPNDEDPEL